MSTTKAFLVTLELVIKSNLFLATQQSVQLVLAATEMILDEISSIDITDNPLRPGIPD